MKKHLVFFFVMAFIFFTVAGNVLATPVSLTDNSLQAIFDDNGWGLNAADDQMNMPAGWNLTIASGGSSMVLYHESDGNNYAFGIYSTCGGEFAEVFGIGDTPVAKAVVGFNDDVVSTQWFDAGNLMIQQKSFAFTGQTFGFYTATGVFGSYDKIIYSDAGKNDLDENGIKGEGDDIGLLVYEVDSASYIFAADMNNNRNFSDIVTQAESIKPAPVPEPSTVMLLGAGLLGLITFGRKRFNKKA